MGRLFAYTMAARFAKEQQWNDYLNQLAHCGMADLKIDRYTGSGAKA